MKFFDYQIYPPLVTLYRVGATSTTADFTEAMASTTTEPAADTAFVNPVGSRLLNKMYLMLQHMEYGQTIINGEARRISQS